jgi:hypothetical protein
MHRNYMKRESTTPGSARASRAGHGSLAMANFCFGFAEREIGRVSARAPWPAREARALPSAAKPK